MPARSRCSKELFQGDLAAISCNRDQPSPWNVTGGCVTTTARVCLNGEEVGKAEEPALAWDEQPGAGRDGSYRRRQADGGPPRETTLDP
jgi:hypothetical protein